MNNPPAFPVTTYINDDHQYDLKLWTGMTLRDYMAAAALQGMCANPNSTPAVGEDVFAKAAYMMADAMLKEREA